MSTSLPPSTPPPLPFDVNNTLGALLVGGLVASAFWGLTSAQTYVYFQQSTKDRLSLKLFVVVLWILDTFDACLTSHILYHYMVTNYMNPTAIAVPVWSALIHTGVTSVTNALIRVMFAQRVWQVSRHSIVLTGTVLVLSLCDFVVGIGVTVKAFQLPSWRSLETISGWLYVIFTTGFTGDLLVAVVLCYYLFKAKTGFQSTDTLVNTLILYIIATGLLTSVDAILGTIFYATMPTNFIFIGFYLSLAKLYINSYLASLNARHRLRERSDGPVSINLTGISNHVDVSCCDPSTLSPTTPIDTKSSRRDLENDVRASARFTHQIQDRDLDYRPYQD